MDKKLNDKLELIGVLVESKAKQEIKDMRAVDTGRLLNSITHEVDKPKRSVAIGTNVKYAPAVELGTYRSTPKPFLRNALLKSRSLIKNIFNKRG